MSRTLYGYVLVLVKLGFFMEKVIFFFEAGVCVSMIGETRPGRRSSGDAGGGGEASS